MHLKIRLFIIIAFLFFSPILVLAEEEDLGQYAEEPIYTLEVPIGNTTEVTGVAGYIEALYTFGISVAGVVAVAMIMFGGWQWIFAAGNEKAITSAKEHITSAVIGLVLAMSSYLILYTINPQLVDLPKLYVAKIVPLFDGSSTGEYEIDDCNLDNDYLSELVFTEIVEGYCLFQDRTDTPPGQGGVKAEDDIVKHEYQNYTGVSGQGVILSSDRLADAIDRYRGNVSPIFMLAQLDQETRLCSNTVSSVGACGVAQFMIDTARQYDSKCGSKLPSNDADACMYLMNNPDYSICLQGAYLNKMYNQYDGDEVLMAAGYNAGEGRNVMSESCPGLLVWQCEADFATDETRNYVKGIAQRKNSFCSELGGDPGVTSEEEAEEYEGD